MLPVFALSCFFFSLHALAFKSAVCDSRLSNKQDGESKLFRIDRRADGKYDAFLSFRPGRPEHSPVVKELQLATAMVCTDFGLEHFSFQCVDEAKRSTANIVFTLTKKYHALAGYSKTRVNNELAIEVLGLSAQLPEKFAAEYSKSRRLKFSFSWDEGSPALCRVDE